jgi:hypothetical protein
MRGNKWAYSSLALSGAERRSRRAIIIPLTLLPLLALLLTACLAFTTTPTTHDISLGDLDNDGDMDAFFANGESEGRQPNSVWVNQGDAHFQDSGQALGNYDTYSVALGDLDNDRDLDALEGGWGVIYLNYGHGRFTKSVKDIPFVDGSYTRFAALGDLDSDGDLDTLLAGCCGAFNGDANKPWVILPASAVFFNDSSGRFTQTQTLTHQGCPAAALGDLDTDGDLDVFLACQMLIQHSGVPADLSGMIDENTLAYSGLYTDTNHAPNLVYFNDGAGNLVDSGQTLGDSASYTVALGDLDGDGDLDALVGNLNSAQVWLNQGGAQAGARGQFAVHPQPITAEYTQKVSLGDVDGDGDLDALLNTWTKRRFGPQLWLNDGAAAFTRSKQNLRIPAMQAYALGDLDGDGDLDIFAGSFSDGYQVWLNDGKGNYQLPPSKAAGL